MRASSGDPHELRCLQVGKRQDRFVEISSMETKQKSTGNPASEKEHALKRERALSLSRSLALSLSRSRARAHTHSLTSLTHTHGWSRVDTWTTGGGTQSTHRERARTQSTYTEQPDKARSIFHHKDAHRARNQRWRMTQTAATFSLCATSISAHSPLEIPHVSPSPHPSDLCHKFSKVSALLYLL